MTEPKQFSDEFEVLYSRGNNPWIGGSGSTVPHKQWHPLPERFWARANSIEGLDEIMQKRHWLGCQDFLIRLARSYFLGEGKLANADLVDCNWCGLGLTGVSQRCRLT